MGVVTAVSLSTVSLIHISPSQSKVGDGDREKDGGRNYNFHREGGEIQGLDIKQVRNGKSQKQYVIERDRVNGWS